MKDFSKRLMVGVTGREEKDWKSKLKEIDKFRITEVSLFLERFEKKEREKIYKALLLSGIRKIPLVHIKNNMAREELSFLKKNFGSLYFTIHEDSFKVIKKWKGFYKDLYLEMNTDNFIDQSVRVDRIGGFCVDLAHFKIEITDWSEEFSYIFERRKTSHYFDCNHLNGYSADKNIDLHWVNDMKEFDYLKTIPEFLFGKIIALETDNSISEQLKFKKYLSGFLGKIFS